MRCASCGGGNPEGAKFCEECGTPFVRICPSCGQQARPTAKFCPECGTALRAEGKPTPTRSRSRKGAQRPKRARQSARQVAPAPSHPASPEAERRQLTVMFCDLVGSTALSEQLDPEDLREVVRAYQETCTGVIQRYDGHIAQHLGDGLLVYFGYPVAHEDEAQRAVRAGIEIIDALRESSLQNKQLPNPLQVRIGIHSGLVVIGEIGSGAKREILALGETPNIAARVQGVAEPDTVVMSMVTQRLVHGLFACQDLGPQTLKGISTPLSVYRVIAESAAPSRFEVAVGAGLTPLVGRAEELGLLQRRWAQAKEGAGQVVLLSGEAGIGKSRLAQALKEQVLADGATRIEFRCSPYHQNSAFYPIIEHLQRLLQFQREERPQAKLAKLQQALVAYRFPQADTLPLLATLLSLPPPEGIPPLTLSPQKQKQKTQEALVAWLMEEAEKAAVYCAWEDLHWADPTTLEFIRLLIEQAPTTRMLVLATFRPEFQPPWSGRSHITQLTLSRLQRPQVEAMVAQVTGGKALPAEVLQQIIGKTDGVPLFVEELTKMVLESKLLRQTDDHYELTGVLPPLAIPSTLQDSLMARLDRLSTVREIVQLGATLGREFSYELLHVVSPLDEETLQQGLRQFVEAELIYQHGLPPQATYLFKHALIQDTAYQSLLKSTRQQYHRQIAQMLEERFPDTTETQPELLARHYTEAGLVGQAVPYWQRAGQRTLERSANVEAIGHLTKGLELLQPLPHTPERAQQELTFQITLGAALVVTRGYAAPEVAKAYTRARALCQQLGETPQLFPVLWGLWNFYLGRELRTARELAEQLLSLAQRVQDPVLLLEAHNALGQTFSCRGELTPARAHLEQSIALYDPRQHRALAFLYGGEDPGVNYLYHTARILWSLGYPDQALGRIPEALTLAQELSHPHSLATALGVAAMVHQHRREGQAAQERAEALIRLATEQGFPYWVGYGTALRGWALAEQGQEEEGIAQVRGGMAVWQDTGTEIGRTYFLALLAEAYGKAGQAEKGLAALADAPALVDKTGDRRWEAELYRIKGELLLTQEGCRLQAVGFRENTTEAEECFHKAIDVARKQQAKSLELRAVLSLARLWQQQGKSTEAHQMLAEIYGWFTEGFDTKDLQEAKALLDALS
jgi:class 3 adenylate cyclase/predicted ATPase